MAPGQGALRLQGSCPWGPAALTGDLVTMPSPRKPLEGGALGPALESCWGIRGITLDCELLSAYTSTHGGMNTCEV